MSPEVEPALAALMADGPLPAEMMGGPVGSPQPTRFCGGNDSGDGGISADGGISPPGPMRPPGGPVVGPIGIPIGMSGGGPVTGPALPPPPGGGGIAGSGGPIGPGDGGMPDGGEGGGRGDCSRVPISFWQFDDCNAGNTDFNDQSFQDHRSFRNVEQQCVPSQEGLGVKFAGKTDLVYAPDQPDYGLDDGVTVAAWVKPDRVDGTRTLLRKRDGGNSAFALLIHGKKFEFVVRLASGKLASVSAPARAGQWTHVAATYDGYDLRLYVGGTEVSTARAEGTLAKGPGPLLIGNDASDRRLEGVVDNVWFNTLAAPADVIMQLTCLRPPPTLSVSPQAGPAVPAGTAVDYTFTIKSNSSPSCAPERFQAAVFGPGGFSADPSFQQTRPVAPGMSVELDVSVTSGEETEPDTYPINFSLFSFDKGFENTVVATYTVVEPTGCHVTSGREIMIRHVSVVDDPIRTSMNGDAADPRTGAWSFGRLMERLSPSAAVAPDVTEDMFRSFLSPQAINGFTTQPRAAMQDVVLDFWPRTAADKLDLAGAPLRLLAIVNRLDLKDLAAGKAGEGRLVYGVLGFEGGFPLEFTVILEYLLPASTEAEYADWVQAFHALQALPFPSEQYNAALQAITDRFTARNAVPSMPNGSSLIDIRTNEIALSFQWELREFRISPTTGFMAPSPVFQTPDQRFNNSERLGRFINANEAVIVSERHEVPLTFEGAPFATGSVFNNIDFWDAPGITNPEARHKLSLNTCNGCHGQETETGFLQINPRSPGEQSALSGFLSGITVSDPITGEPRRLAELARRRALMEAVVCADQTP
ncbi:MAG TPA: LamG domain-containing protein [Polyangiales bacterium]|nr:LamG domain-containing protein [Polyangiales bacterium]